MFAKQSDFSRLVFESGKILGKLDSFEIGRFKETVWKALTINTAKTGKLPSSKHGNFSVYDFRFTVIWMQSEYWGSLIGATLVGTKWLRTEINKNIFQEPICTWRHHKPYDKIWLIFCVANSTTHTPVHHDLGIKPHFAIDSVNSFQ